MYTRDSESYPQEERSLGQTKGAPLLAGLMIGGLLGAGAMLLLAPQPGKQTREEIKDGATELRDRTTENMRGKVAEVKSRAENMASNVRERAMDLQKQGKNLAMEQLDRVANAAQSGKRSIEASKNHS